MQKLSYETMQNFCRTCLKEITHLEKFKISILNLQIRLWLEDASLDNPLSDDTYPNSICQSCKNKLKEFLEFLAMCKQSKQTIYRLLPKNNENKTHGNLSKYKCRNDNSEVYGNDFAFNFVTNDGNNSKPNADLNVIDEPLICGASLYINHSRDTSLKIKKKTSNCAENNSKYGESGMLKSSFVDIAESEEVYTDSKRNKCREDYTSETIKNIKYDNIDPTKTESIISISQAARKKYTYLFRCDLCKYRSVSQQTLDIHMRTHYGLKPYQCPKCDESFNKSTVMLKHLNEKHNEKELIIICEHEECHKQFNSSRNYKDHYRQNHTFKQPNQKKEKSTTKTSQRHVCEECGKIYTKSQTFKEHQYTHGPKELYPFQCDECEKAFVKQRTFNEHKLRHAGIKNFECLVCKAKKTTKKELRSHMNSHTRERQYPCPNCSMIFYRSSNRRIHVDVVHQGIRRYACRFCDQTFGKGDNLKNHELLHTGEKPHACAECGKRFVQRVSLRSHMKTHN